ncbi:invasion associated locus B family protein [Terrihabitans rhizophilus]|jgi:invasion protein IalB|uniref:Invasion associated locus B family protein n=1 Tax=Terrihabitans rhizophilus TaxID=3092662 RepID=A0ABU4RMK8_9HYPH|nr:invasion associated locus B family protein [Terrihabitans sp. PJ23]MDX6804970.1 invasion associated locus B family protein [Terrihabitans sp. PJ23]
MRPFLPTAAGLLLLSSLPVLAQAPATPRAQKAEPAAPPAAPAIPQKREEIVYGAWTLVCTSPAQGAGAKVCNAVLRIREQKSGKAVLGWIIARTEAGGLAGVFETPTGVQIPAGVELTLGKGAVRKLPYDWCDPQRCQARATIDAAFLKELSAAGTASVKMVSKEGKAVNLGFGTEGFDKVAPSFR